MLQRKKDLYYIAAPVLDTADYFQYSFEQYEVGQLAGL
jgi:hypothetical protein